MDKKKIIITGYYNKKNKGDDIFYDIAFETLAKNKNYEVLVVPSNMLHIYMSQMKTVDSIILFGGETLNDYFLKPLAKIKEANQGIKLYAIGVGIGQDLQSIKYYISMFQYYM